MAFPYGFLEVEITFGVVAKIVPYQVVVEINSFVPKATSSIGSLGMRSILRMEKR